MPQTIDAAVPRSGLDGASASPPWAEPTTVAGALAQLRSSGGGGLAEALAGLSPQDRNEAVSQLSRGELAGAAQGLNTGPGRGALSVDARRDAFGALAGTLDATQLGRLSAALTSPGARAELASAVDRAAPASVRAEFDGTRSDAPGDALVTGVGAASGREQYVGAQTGRAAGAAARAPAVDFSGDLFRAVPTGRASTYADHSWSGGGRYNAPGQSTLYTSPSLGDLQAEVANYSGLSGQSVMRAYFQGRCWTRAPCRASALRR